MYQYNTIMCTVCADSTVITHTRSIDNNIVHLNWCSELFLHLYLHIYRRARYSDLKSTILQLYNMSSDINPRKRTSTSTDTIAIDAEHRELDATLESIPTLPKKPKTTVSELSTSIEQALLVMQDNMLKMSAQMTVGFSNQIAQQTDNDRQFADLNKVITEHGENINSKFTQLSDSIGQRVTEGIEPLQTRLSQLESRIATQQSPSVFRDVEIQGTGINGNNNTSQSNNNISFTTSIQLDSPTKSQGMLLLDIEKGYVSKLRYGASLDVWINPKIREKTELVLISTVAEMRHAISALVLYLIPRFTADRPDLTTMIVNYASQWQRILNNPTITHIRDLVDLDTRIRSASKPYVSTVDNTLRLDYPWLVNNNPNQDIQNDIDEAIRDSTRQVYHTPLTQRKQSPGGDSGGGPPVLCWWFNGMTKGKQAPTASTCNKKACKRLHACLKCRLTTHAQFACTQPGEMLNPWHNG